MLHLMKLAVGVKDVDALRILQKARLANDPPLRHMTRMMPRRADEITQGGSIYWVINGMVQARQRLIGIESRVTGDSVKRTALLLDPDVIAVAARRIKPFQGWRYMKSSDAPADLDQASIDHHDVLPVSLQRALAHLCLV